MKDTTYRTLELSQTPDGVLTIALNRPERLNAINETLHEELADVFTVVADWGDVHVIVLTGRGSAFSAGGDADWFTTVRSADAYYRVFQDGYKIVRRLLEIPQPVIARVNGHAIGLGATLVLYSDLAVAVRQAKIGDPHVNMALVAGDGGALIWPLVLGPHRAKEMLFTGRLLSGEEAAQRGLINEAVDADQLDVRVNAWIDALRGGSRLAIQLTKRSINRLLKKWVDDVVEPSLAFEALSFLHPDQDEAVRAFRERRRPHFDPPPTVPADET